MLSDEVESLKLLRMAGVSSKAYNDQRAASLSQPKALFKRSRESLGYRELCKNLRKEGFKITRHRTRKFMAQLNLVVKQQVAYKVTTKRKHSDAVANNLLNQNFNPLAPNQIWVGDVTYLKAGEGWMCLAAVMDLYSSRIVGWHIDKPMTTDLVMKALIKAYNLRKPAKGLGFHSDRGSQYTSKRYRSLLKQFDMRASMGGLVGIMLLWKGLKHDWLLKVVQTTREHIKSDVTQYMKYYNLKRLDSANNDQSPVEYENSIRKASGWG